MSGSSRLSVMGRFEHTVNRHGLLPQGGKVLVAVSGGPDSVCLLDLLRVVSARRGLDLVGFHLNHRLRKSANQDERFVRRLFGAEPLIVVRSDVGRYARRRGLGVEEAARAVRYRHMERIAEKLGCDVVALGHNADDNLETMLLNLARGAGLSGLAGIPVKRGIFVRPLLDIERESIIQYLRARSLDWVEDETNQDPGFKRNLLRLQAVPALKAVNPEAVANAGRAAALLREEDGYLDCLALEALGRVAKLNRSHAVVDCIEFGTYNLCLKRRMIRQLVPGLDSEGVGRVLDFLKCDARPLSAVVKGVRLDRRGRNVTLHIGNA